MAYEAPKDYVDVAERIVEFRGKYPDGALQPVDPSKPYEVVSVGEKTFIVYAAAAYRSPADTVPGIGVAWEPFPGRTPFTRDSELQNAETAAWGRAMVAALAVDTKRGIASLQEVTARANDSQADAPRAPSPVDWRSIQEAEKKLRDANDIESLKAAWAAIAAESPPDVVAQLDAVKNEMKSKLS